MASASKSTIKTYFQTGDKPTQAQFIDLIDSYQDVSDIATAIASGVQGGKVGLIDVTGSAGVSFRQISSVGLALVSAGTAASARSVIGAGTLTSVSAGNAIQASAGSTTLDISVNPQNLVRVGTTASQSPYSGPTTVSANHGLGGVPHFVDLRMVCLNADAGYSPGQIIDLNSSYCQNNTAGNRAITVEKTAAALLIHITNAEVFVTHKGSAAAIALTATNWRLEAVPYRFFA